eukprot:CAMPEP_0170543554 /NCGR_PEP_ID=MMETSP0211-20121228/2636_1 /TAXON_ID=311385 /ORGANISM="Pseudokeronopsis sp., Strain OXSARD2" /LENGTH=55 /DNA_ID=CAMNT_0010846963 /DNA_START=697 /DNA_END=864 /DNA_ORIENTATION=-
MLNIENNNALAEPDQEKANEEERLNEYEDNALEFEKSKEGDDLFSRASKVSKQMS